MYTITKKPTNNNNNKQKAKTKKKLKTSKFYPD